MCSTLDTAQQKNWYNLELLQIYKCHYFCCSKQKNSHGMYYAALPKPLTKHNYVNCLWYEAVTRKQPIDNLYALRALFLHLHANGELKEGTSKLFNTFLEKFEDSNPAGLQGVYMKEFPIGEDMFQKNIFLYDIDFMNEAMIGVFDGKMPANILTPLNYFFTRVTLVTSLMSKYFSKLIPAHCEIKSLKKLVTWRDIWQLPMNESNTFSPKTGISSLKH